MYYKPVPNVDSAVVKIERNDKSKDVNFEKFISFVKKAFTMRRKKLSANLGLTANKISSELSYAKTDAYLNSLIKKLEREHRSAEETEDKE